MRRPFRAAAFAFAVLAAIAGAPRPAAARGEVWITTWSAGEIYRLGGLAPTATVPETASLALAALGLVALARRLP